MSFNTNKNVRTDPLIEDDSQDQFNELQNNFLQFIKLYDEITEYDLKLNNLSRKEYDKIKDEMYILTS
jgi:hypothetical protein